MRKYVDTSDDNMPICFDKNKRYLDFALSSISDLQKIPIDYIDDAFDELKKQIKNMPRDRKNTTSFFVISLLNKEK